MVGKEGELLDNIVFYHDDGEGARLEQRVRQEARALVEELDQVVLVPMPDILDRVVPVPSTDDVVGLFKGGVILEVIYKRYGSFRAEDLMQVDAFYRGYLAALQMDLVLLRRRELDITEGD